MSTRGELVHGALTDEPQTRAEIAEQLGIEAQAVSAELNALQAKGLAQRGAGGWVAGSGKPGRKVHEASEPAPAPPQAPKRRGRTPGVITATVHSFKEGDTITIAGLRTARKPRGRPKAAEKVQPRAAKVQRPAAAADGRVLEFAISESGKVVFEVISGPRSGERGMLGAADSRALYSLMHKQWGDE